MQHADTPITILGSGNVATHLALAFHQAGYPIAQIWSRDFDHAEILAYRVDAEPINQLSLLKHSSAVYILAVSDDALYELPLDLDMREALVLHTSGSVPLSVLRSTGRYYGVLYAPQTFVRSQQMDYSRLPFCIEASNPVALQMLQQLATSVSTQVYEVDSDQRRWLHLASVFVNNFGNALHALSQDLLEAHGLRFEMLQPLIEMTTQKAVSQEASNHSLWKLQTGPAIRHDEKTIDRHLTMLKEDPTLFDLYQLFSHTIQEHCTPKEEKA